MRWSAPQAARDGLMQQRTLVFVDEVHRFRQSRQPPHINQQLKKPIVRLSAASPLFNGGETSG